jgi:DNA repair protein RadC
MDYGLPEVQSGGCGEIVVPAMEMYDHELVGAVLGDDEVTRELAGSCESLFALFSGRTLSSISSEEISAGCDLPRKAAEQLSAAIELARRLLWPEEGAGPICSPRDACRAASHIRGEDKEHFIAIYLNARNTVIGEETISVGSLNANIVHPREVFRPAIGHAAAAVVLAHNHPSGEVTPSQEDLNLTARLVEAGKLLGIEILDHLIVTEGRFLSLRSESYL